VNGLVNGGWFLVNGILVNGQVNDGERKGGKSLKFFKVMVNGLVNGSEWDTVRSPTPL
jgi:hypothetical protein